MIAYGTMMLCVEKKPGMRRLTMQEQLSVQLPDGSPCARSPALSLRETFAVASGIIINHISLSDYHGFERFLLIGPRTQFFPAFKIP